MQPEQALSSRLCISLHQAIAPSDCVVAYITLALRGRYVDQQRPTIPMPSHSSFEREAAAASDSCPPPFEAPTTHIVPSHWQLWIWP
mmetsp:Transcript_40926/g.65802  ORF Transcript_40926/g.65802 Transcript_40926/m.65802 type:complete len:87 (+) Transcript_40926:160-420(+)